MSANDHLDEDADVPSLLPPPAPAPVHVDALGTDGDGIATLPDGARLYLPLTLPGERVQPGPVHPRGDAWTAEATILDPSPLRITPPCQHFGTCGGCTAQHMDDGFYARWKTSLLEDALRRLGLDAPLPPLARTPPGARRRMDLAITRTNGVIAIGLHRRRSNAVVDMHECPVLHPALFAAVTALRAVLRSLDALRREGSAIVNLLDDGVDLLLRTDAALTAADRTRLAALAQRHDIPRISWALGRGLPEAACVLRPGMNGFSGHMTPVPPGAFLQASREGEAAIQAAVLAALPKLRARGRIIELFAGVGSLTHALATRAAVHALEGDEAAVQALRAAGDPRVTATVRDLVRQPLQPKELSGAGCVVLDPPWNGAGPQMATLAASRRPIVYVTCNPAALLRDGRALLAAGYRVSSAAAIDQFLWSARIEGVVGFTPPS